MKFGAAVFFLAFFCAGILGHDHRSLQNGDLACGTKDMNEAERRGQRKALSLVQLKKSKLDPTVQYQANTPKVIPVCFHIVGVGILDRITKKDLKNELDALNRAYSSSSCCDSSLDWCNGQCSEPDTNIKFVIAKSFFRRVTGTVSSPSSLFSCVDRMPFPWKMSSPLFDRMVKRRKHRGDNRVLNVYYSNLGDSGLLGFAYFPSILMTPDSFLDGVVIHRDSRVGGSISGYTEGDTLAHEVGHWLGLPHPFQGGCLGGDGISDTAATAGPVRGAGCDAAKNIDTCPDQDGLDPVNNFMHYSRHECQFEWTQGQVDVMHANIEYYRTKSDVPTLQSVELALGEYSDSFSLAVGASRGFHVDVPESSNLFCKIYGGDGDIDLSVQWENSDQADCTSTLSTSSDACIIGPGAGRAEILVYAYLTTVDFTVYCNVVDTQDDAELTGGESVTDINLKEGELQRYSLDTGELSALEKLGSMECISNASGSPADVDLFLQSNDIFDCVSSTKDSAAEKCEVSLFGVSAVDVWLYSALSTDANITLDCKIVPLSTIVLTSGVESSANSLITGSSQFFSLDVESEASVTCTVQGENGDADLYMAWNNPTDFACSASTPGTDEVCALAPDTGTVYALVLAYSSTFDFTVTCTIE